MIEQSPELARLLAKQQQAELLDQARRRQLRRAHRPGRPAFAPFAWIAKRRGQWDAHHVHTAPTTP